MQHTGQGQIIEANAITQDELGNWVPAKEEPYMATLLDKIKCFIGYHSWRFTVSPNNGVLVIPDMIPDDAKCIACGADYVVKG